MKKPERPVHGGADAARARARTLREAGWHTSAIDLLAAGIKAHRGHVGLRIDLTEALLATGRLEEAETIRIPGRPG